MIKQLENYGEYLWKLGLINGGMRTKFNDLVSSASNLDDTADKNQARANAKQMKQLAISSLVKVLSNLSSTQLEEISFNVYETYTYSKREKQQQKLRQVRRILENKLNLNQTYFLQKLRSSIGSVTQDLEIKKLKTYVNELMSENEKYSGEIEKLNKKDYSRITTHHYHSEQRNGKINKTPFSHSERRTKSRDPSKDESVFNRLYQDSKRKHLHHLPLDRSLHQCTFRPSVISKRPGGSSSTGSLIITTRGGVSTVKGDEEIFGRLYAQVYDKQNQLKIHEAEKSKQEVKDCTFKPQITRKKGSQETTNQSSREEQDIFTQLYNEGKNKLEQRRRSLEADQHHQLRELEYCTFAPRINDGKVTKVIVSKREGPLFDRLYQDSKESKRKSYERKLKQDREQFQECRFIPKVRSSSRDSSDQKIFNKLYEDRQKYDKKLKQSQNDQLEQINTQVNSVKALPLPKKIYSPKYTKINSFVFKK